jgi:hypothetical protein
MGATARAGYRHDRRTAFGRTMSDSEREPVIKGGMSSQNSIDLQSDALRLEELNRLMVKAVLESDMDTLDEGLSEYIEVRKRVKTQLMDHPAHQIHNRRVSVGARLAGWPVAALNSDQYRFPDGNKLMELTLAIIISLVTGVLAGLYSGLIVARISRFEELRNEIKRIILGFEFVYDGQTLELSTKRDPGALVNASSDLIAFGHEAAGNVSLSIYHEMSTVLNVPGATYKMAECGFSQWQDSCREMKPNMKVILSLRPWF